MNQALLRETLARTYAAGALEPALALLVETQAAIAPEARREIDTAESAAAAMFDRADSPRLSASALDAVFAKIDSAPEFAAPANDHAQSEIDHLPAPVREAARRAFGVGEKWTFAGAGMRALVLSDSDGLRCELLRIQPGQGAPTHTHKGAEYTLVLQGAFHDGYARYGVGEISYATPDLTHRPIAEPGPICYALAVTEEGLKFKGALGAMQRLFFG